MRLWWCSDEWSQLRRKKGSYLSPPTHGGGGPPCISCWMSSSYVIFQNTISTYFPDITLNTHFLHVFLNFPACFFSQIYDHCQKNSLFCLILDIFEPLNDVRVLRIHCLVLKTTLIMCFVLQGWYPPWNTSGPHPRHQPPSTWTK